MTNSQCIAKSLSRVPLPKIPDLMVLRLRIFLYRAPQPRPYTDFRLDAPDPAHFSHVPWLGNTNPGFDLYLDRHSFPQPLPAHFFVQAAGISGPRCEWISITRSGSGRDHSDPEDLAVLRGLWNALRTFPLDWTTRGIYD